MQETTMQSYMPPFRNGLSYFYSKFQLLSSPYKQKYWYSHLPQHSSSFLWLFYLYREKPEQKLVTILWNPFLSTVEYCISNTFSKRTK